MAKTDWKAEAKSLKKKLKKKVEELTHQLDQFRGTPAPAKAAKPVSPLAPAAFPVLPVIKGAAFAAIGAGIKYQNRRDVMLVSLCPGTTIAGVFTRAFIAPSFIVLLRGSNTASTRCRPTRWRRPSTVTRIAVGWCAKSS